MQLEINNSSQSKRHYPHSPVSSCIFNQQPGGHFVLWSTLFNPRLPAWILVNANGKRMGMNNGNMFEWTHKIYISVHIWMLSIRNFTTITISFERFFVLRQIVLLEPHLSNLYRMKLWWYSGSCDVIRWRNAAQEGSQEIIVRVSLIHYSFLCLINFCIWVWFYNWKICNYPFHGMIYQVRWFKL